VHPGGRGAAAEAEEVPLPGHAALSGEDAPQGAAVEDAGQNGDADRHQAALEEAPQQQVAQIAEDQAAGPDVHRPRAPEEPDAEAADEHHHHGDPQPVPQSAHQHEPPQDEQGDGVGEQVSQAGVEERGEGDAPQPALAAGPDPRPVEGATEDEQVDQLDQPDQGDEAEQDAEPGGQVGPGPRRPDGAHSHADSYTAGGARLSAARPQPERVGRPETN
jgi:hypothetical protein